MVSKYNKSIQWVLTIYQIFGGIIGIYYTLLSIESANLISEYFIKIFLLLPFFLFSIVAGMMIALKDNLVLTCINLSLQVIQFKIGSYALYYTAGTYLCVGYKFWDGLFFNFSGIASFVLLKINSVGGKSIISLNLISIVLLLIAVYPPREP